MNGNSCLSVRPDWFADVCRGSGGCHFCGVGAGGGGCFRPGIYHYSNEGVCSWYDFAVKIMELGNAPCRVLPIESKDYPAKAARPHFSVLNKAKIKTIYKISISHWEASLRECMKRITK